MVAAAVGPDPFLDSTRAIVLATRNGPGDLDQAGIKVAQSIHAEPELAVCRMARMSVALRRRQSPTALADLDELSRRSLVHLPEVEASPLFAEPLTTPEYAAWRAKSN